MKRSQANIERIRRLIPQLYLDSARLIAKVTSGEHPAAHETKMTNQIRAALVVTQGFMAAERARETANTPQQPGVIVVHARLEDTPQNRLSWEQEAARLSDSRAIEAVALPAKKETDGS